MPNYDLSDLFEKFKNHYDNNPDLKKLLIEKVLEDEKKGSRKVGEWVHKKHFGSLTTDSSIRRNTVKVSTVGVRKNQ